MTSLDAIIRNPALIAELPPEEAARILGQLATIQTYLVVRAFAGMARDDERIIPIADAAKDINRSRDWIEKRRNELPWLRYDAEGRLLGASVAALREWIRYGGNNGAR